MAQDLVYCESPNQECALKRDFHILNQGSQREGRKNGKKRVCVCVCVCTCILYFVCEREMIRNREIAGEEYTLNQPVTGCKPSVNTC